jgi:hypothetical protein
MIETKYRVVDIADARNGHWALSNSEIRALEADGIYQAENRIGNFVQNHLPSRGSIPPYIAAKVACPSGRIVRLVFKTHYDPHGWLSRLTAYGVTPSTEIDAAESKSDGIAIQSGNRKQEATGLADCLTA